MLVAIVRKECRELLPFIVLALVVQVLDLCRATGMYLGVISNLLNMVDRSDPSLPFINDSFCYWSLVVSGLLAVTMGLWQTMWESSRGTFQFLLHRPIARQCILGVKLSVGLTIGFLIAITPILYYALCAATPGHVTGPFYWSMTARIFLLTTLIPLAYLAAFLSGLRRARRFGSRFFPLFTAILFGVAIHALADSLPGWEPLLLTVVVAVDACYLLAILHVAATSDFS